jgi:uncharacterized protein YcsI (UPF0317 family)
MHGTPVSYDGDWKKIGIKDINTPEYGESVDIY